MSRLLLPTLLLLLAFPVAAQAAAPWSAPAPIPGSPPAFPQLAMSPQGSAFVGWSEGGALGTGTPRVFGTVRTPGAPFFAARQLGRLQLVAVGAYHGANYLALGETGNRHLHAGVAAVRNLRRVRPIGPRGDSYAVALAVNVAGDAAALIRACEGTSPCHRSVPYLVVRRRGGAWGRAIRLDAHGPSIFGAVAVDARGDVLAVWERPLHGSTGERGIYARIRTARGRLGAAQRLGTAEPFPAISAALGSGRRAIVAWKSQGSSDGDAGTPATIRAAIATPGHRFASAQQLEVVNVTGSGLGIGQAGVRVAIAADGRPIVAWTGYAGGHFVVRAAPVTGSRVGTGQIVSDPTRDTLLSDLATGAQGQALVLGIQGLRGSNPNGPLSVVAAARPSAADVFGPVEPITDPGQYFEAARAAFLPDGHALAVWRSLQPGAVMWSQRLPVP